MDAYTEMEWINALKHWDQQSVIFVILNGEWSTGIILGAGNQQHI